MIAIVTLIAFVEFVIILTLLDRPKRTSHDKLVDHIADTILESQQGLKQSEFTRRLKNNAIFRLFARIAIALVGASYIALAIVFTLAVVGGSVYVVIHHWHWI